MNDMTGAVDAAELVDIPLDRFFNPWRVPVTTSAREFVAAIVRDVEAHERDQKLRLRRRRPADQETFEATVSAVVCDLVHAVISEAEAGFVVSRSFQELGRRSRYRAPALNKTFPGLLDVLGAQGLGIVRQDLGFQRFQKPGQRTRLLPGAGLLQRLGGVPLQFEDFHEDRAEVLILKAEKQGHWDTGKLVEYPETEDTSKLRAEVRRINTFLRGADLNFDEGVVELTRPLDLTNRQLKRIFNNGRFNSGGRLFGGFWQPLPKKHRLAALTIGDEAVVELDYGQMALRTLYGLEGKPVPHGDLYAIPGLEGWRDGTKTLVNALLFSEGKRTKKPQGTKTTLPPKASAGDLIRRISEFHAPVAHHFGTEVGHHLQFIESEVMMGVLLQLMEESIVTLPIHDAVLGPWSKKDRVKEVMMEVFEKRVGVGAMVTLTE